MMHGLILQMLDNFSILDNLVENLLDNGNEIDNPNFDEDIDGMGSMDVSGSNPQMMTWMVETFSKKLVLPIKKNYYSFL